MALDLGNLAPEAGVEVEVDRLGGSRVLETGIYLMTVDKAFITKSKGGASALNVWLKGAKGEEHKEVFWMTSGTAKGGKNYYMGKDGKTKHYLPGFNNANALCMLTLGGQVHQLGPHIETKSLMIYDYTQKKEVPTDVDMVMPLIGTQAHFAIVKQIVDKTKADANGVYQPTGETREQNEVSKLFRLQDKMTVQEITAKATAPAFYDLWDKKMSGQTIDKAKKTGAVTGSAAAPALGSTEPAPFSL